MKRLTTETPDGNFETMLNFVFSQDGWAHIRHDGNEGSVPLTQWAKAQCILHGCGEFSAETPQEIDEEICDCMMMDFPDCPIGLAYCFAVQASHLRNRLKMYEDIFFAEDGTERLPLDVLRELAGRTVPCPNPDLSQAQRGVGDRGGGPVHPPAPGIWGAGKAHAAGASPLRHPGGYAPSGQRGGNGRYADPGLS